MGKRLKTIGGATAALAALALGGSAIASATQPTASASKHHAVKHHAAEKTTGPDTDAIQSGDQTSPDVKGKASSTTAAEPVVSETAPETSTETSSESSTPSDGPGGHEDPAGEVDFQSEAQE
jgi:hypothetical protein